MSVAMLRQQDPSALSPEESRRQIRSGRHKGSTANMAPGHVQGNVVILPEPLAFDFLAFCQANPKPCPLLAVSTAGDPFLPALGSIDIRTDVPMYNVYRNGVLDQEVEELSALWRDDLVTFVLGCSYSFEEPLLEEGIPIRHIELGRVVPMYRT
ncbi:MAG: D-glutamate cyclase family protein, partial [Hyphomicrobiales bacterium]